MTPVSTSGGPDLLSFALSICTPSVQYYIGASRDESNPPLVGWCVTGRLHSGTEQRVQHCASHREPRIRLSDWQWAAAHATIASKRSACLLCLPPLPLLQVLGGWNIGWQP